MLIWYANTLWKDLQPLCIQAEQLQRPLVKVGSKIFQIGPLLATQDIYY